MNSTQRRPFLSFTTGTVIGTLGGLIELGGAEFRLPVLVGLFRYRVLLVILVTVCASLVFRVGLQHLDRADEWRDCSWW